MLKEFEFKRSRLYAFFIMIFTLSSVVILSLLTLAWWLKLGVLFVLIYYSSLVFIRYALLRAKDSIIGLKVQHDDVFLIFTPLTSYTGKLQRESIVTPWVSILRFQIEGEKRCVGCVVTRDSLPSTYRQFVILLKSLRFH